HGFRGDLRVTAPRVGQAEPVLEQADGVAPRDESPEQRQPGLGLVRGEEPPQRIPEAVVAEVVEPGVPRGLGEERRLVEPDERGAGGRGRAADAVRRGEAERGGHGVASAARATVAGPPRRCGADADERRRARIDASTYTWPMAGG